ncbi:alpha/beta hydrolase [Nocardia asteroides]
MRDDAVLERNIWQTFLNDELPSVVEEFLRADGNRTAVGVSMSGTSVLNLAIAKPGFWRSVASYSGCAQASDPIGQEFVRITVETWGGGQSIENMWGPRTGPLWRVNDPLVNAEGLRGTEIYLSTGSGIPAAAHDTPADPRVRDGGIPLPIQIAFGGPIEAAVRFCTVNLAGRLRELNIPVNVDERPVGTHSWGYGEDDLRSSWLFWPARLGAGRPELDTASLNTVTPALKLRLRRCGHLPGDTPVLVSTNTCGVDYVSGGSVNNEPGEVIIASTIKNGEREVRVEVGDPRQDTSTHDWLCTCRVGGSREHKVRSPDRLAAVYAALLDVEHTAARVDAPKGFNETGSARVPAVPRLRLSARSSLRPTPTSGAILGILGNWAVSAS